MKFWNAVRAHVSEEQRPKVLAKIIDALADQDWDCEHEIEDEWPEARAALKLYNPDFGGDGDEDA